MGTVQTAKYWAEIFSEMKPDELLWVTYTDKSDLADEVDVHANEIIGLDDDDNPLIEFDVDKDFTDDLFRNILEKISADDHVWEVYSTTVDECMREVIDEYVNKKCEVVTDDKELWEA